MADNVIQGGGVIAELSAEEQAVLAKALRRVESEVFHAALRRISAFFAVIAVLLTIAGLIGFSSLWSGVETKAVEKLANDSDMRDKVQKGVMERIQRLQQQSAEIERENARAAGSLVSDLEEIHEMIKQVKDDILNRRHNSKNGNRNGNGKGGGQ
jgi:uncharacterized protein (UPF0332 family)